jgi:hypothetical protein
MLPQCYPNYKTVLRRFHNWCRSDVLREAMTDLANALRDEGALDESQCFIDATFASAKGGGDEIARRSVVRVRKFWQLSTVTACPSQSAPLQPTTMKSPWCS